MHRRRDAVLSQQVDLHEGRLPAQLATQNSAQAAVAAAESAFDTAAAAGDAARRDAQVAADASATARRKMEAAAAQVGNCHGLPRRNPGALSVLQCGAGGNLHCTECQPKSA